APDGFNSNVMVQGGYNAQNNDFGNYKLNAAISNRFLDQKLGIDLNVSSERVNRSTQLMTAGYEITTNSAPEGEYEPMRVTNIGLNDIQQFKFRNSGSLVFDYRFSPRSSLEFSNFFAYTPSDHTNISKNYNPKAANTSINVHDLTKDEAYLYSGTINGLHNLGVVEIDYGVSYSRSTSNTEVRNFGIINMKGYQDAVTAELRNELSLAQLIELADDDPTEANLQNFGMPGPGSDNFTDLAENRYSSHLNFKVPYTISNGLAGFLKFGAQVKYKDRYFDQDVRVFGGPPFHKLISGIQQTPDGINWALDWVRLNDQNHVYMSDMVGGTKGEFLQGGFDFGWYPDVSRLNEVYEWWQEITGYYMDLYKDDPTLDRLLMIFGQPRMIGYYDPKPSAMNDNKTNETYYAGYFMTQLNIGNDLILTPGFRYENMHNWLEGWWLHTSIDEGLRIPGYLQDTTRQNEFLLPMVHLKYRPLKWLHFQLSYTKTINRPNYNYIIPYEYVKDDLDPFGYEFGNPGLKAERWTNYDLVVAFHSNKLGLLSLNGFYKNVEDKVWQRKWKRLPGEEIITTSFSDADAYDV
ncbi:MAG: TonB-dependent receptor, partial [Bacteroidales bacterium]|nr:TonB-dependent receptor [Bacteroidales bacterium]